MAMTKKEQARVEQLLTEAALRRTAPVEPDVMPPKYGEPLSKGWDFNEYAVRVFKVCSSSIYHGTGTWEKTDSQGSVSSYSTRMMALKALRYQVEQEAAKRLRRVDTMIEAEGAGE